MANGWNSDSDRDAMLRRVAIVLSSLPAPTANRLLGTMGDESRVAVRQTMTRLSDVDPLERQRAIQAFRVSIQQQPAAEASPATSDETVSRVMPAATVDVTSVATDQAKANSPVPDSPLAFLSDVDDDLLCSLLVVEHPQAIALVLASIAPDQAARLLPRLDGGLRNDTLTRLGRLGEIPEAAAAEVAAHFRTRLSDQHRNGKPTGQRALDAILAAMPRDASADSKDPSVGSVTQSGSDLIAASSNTVPVSSPAPSAAEDSAVDLSSKLRQAVGLNAEAREENADSPALQSKPNAHSESQQDSAVELRVAEVGSAAAGHVDLIDHALTDAITASPLPGPDASPFRSTDSIHQHLIALEPMELCRALGKVDTRDAMLSLCGLPNPIAEAALAILPRGHAKKVRASMSDLGSVQLREIDDAKERVARASLAALELLAESMPVAA
ncbi:MAG: FliG C-terminal domain-containing protein [Rubripirellula sp.]|nr:FliG C-terminal domain-containing protein [Rubripirellula sp.]